MTMAAPPDASPSGAQLRPRKPALRPVGLLKSLGPGLVTGAADDDPSGIATYSQVGAQFGYGLAWTMLFSFPLMAVIQAVSARIGCVTGYGIAQNLRRHYSPWLLRAVVLLLLVANVINLGADLGAMGAALGLLIGGPELLYTVLFGVVCILLETFMSYARYAAVLKWATLCLFAYVAVVFAAHVPWGSALYGTFVPHFVFDAPHAMAMVAVLGTTISPYLFFWQAGQEVEELHRRHVKALCIAPRDAGPELVAHPHRHHRRNGNFAPHRSVHHLRHGGDIERQRRDRYPDVLSSGRGAAADCGRVHIRAVRGRHHCDRHAGRAGARRLRGLWSERESLAGRKVSTTA